MSLQFFIDVKTAEKHQAALEESRMRMQERQNKMANEYSEKMKEVCNWKKIGF